VSERVQKLSISLGVKHKKIRVRGRVESVAKREMGKLPELSINNISTLHITALYKQIYAVHFEYLHRFYTLVLSYIWGSDNKIKLPYKSSLLMKYATG
jgi:hypothetical protein